MYPLEVLVYSAGLTAVIVGGIAYVVGRYVAGKSLSALEAEHQEQRDMTEKQTQLLLAEKTSALAQLAIAHEELQYAHEELAKHPIRKNGRFAKREAD